MRKIEMKEIEINGEPYPYYCDLYVLSLIQDRMPIDQFERDIIGAVIERDEAGEPLRTEDGRLKIRFEKYVLETMIFGLTLMINEGIQIRNEQEEQQDEPVTESYVGRCLTMTLNELSDLIHDEFNRCFNVKKNPMLRKNPKKKTSK